MTPSIPIQQTYFAPGHRLNSAYLSQVGTLALAASLREVIWDYPIIPGAFLTYMQMVAGREWVVSSTTATKASRTVDLLNESRCRNFDGTVSYGLEDVLRRHALDNLAIGRFIWTDRNGYLEYLDPAYMIWNQSQNQYDYSHILRPESYSPEQLSITQQVSLGASGKFISPLYTLIPSAVMQWLVREHDTASADGRKIRDIYITLKGIKESLTSALNDHLESYNMADFSKHGVSVVEISLPENMSAGQIDVSKLIHRIGIAEIPQGYDRDAEEFKYVNEIAAVTGMSLRHFWNSEKATNRALEEVQEARQQQKGPTAMVRSWARAFNNSGIYERYGLGVNTRMEFIEEVDQQTALTDSQVLLNYANAFAIFRAQFGDRIDIQKLLAWLQSKHQLPPDITIDETVLEGTMLNSDPLATPLDGGMVESDPAPTPAVDETKKPDPVEKSINYPTHKLKYDQVMVNSKGVVIEARRHVFQLPRMIEKDYLDNPEFVQSVTNPPKTLNDMLYEEHLKSVVDLKEKSALVILTLPDRKERIQSVNFDTPSPEDLRFCFETMTAWEQALC